MMIKTWMVSLVACVVFCLGIGNVAQGEEVMGEKQKKMIRVFNAETQQYETVEKIEKTEDQWQKELSEDICYIARQKGTERPFTGALLNVKGHGIFKCAVCGNHLFYADHKFESGTGWPSFFQPVAEENVGKEEDFSHGMHRVEVTCGRCGSHLGHVFPDGPKPTGLRYCINSKALEYQELKGK